MSPETNGDVTLAPRLWRFGLVQLVQVPVLLLALFGAEPWALWTAATVGSIICAGGTDSTIGPGQKLARWLNRALILQAILWLTAALVLALVLGLPA